MTPQRFVSFLPRAGRRLLRAARGIKERALASVRQTFPASAPEKLSWRCGFLDMACLARIGEQMPGHADEVRRQAEEFLAHRFDLLGSGPVFVAHGITCNGLDGHQFPAAPAVVTDSQGAWLRGRINRSNLAEARRIWSFVDPTYRTIDWQLDFRSGFRWSELTWGRDIRFAQYPGQDVKVPWELARMQHLPVLALAAHYALQGADGFRGLREYGDEIRCQILDFIATNPPGFGVNWSCAMDVAIRMANILVACDILQAAGYSLDPATVGIIGGSVLSHSRHVASNLEWEPHFRGNHYLANIVGLLFGAVYLGQGKEADLWLHFASSELLGELAYQFHEDGSNFEASVCYHRLSGEIVLWGLALLDGLSAEQCRVLERSRRSPWRRPPRRVLLPLALHLVPGARRMGPVPPWCRERVAAMGRFTQALTRPDGCVTQFGDNDSGRFISLAGIEQVRAVRGPASAGWSLDHSGFLRSCQAFLGGTPAEVGAELLIGFARRSPTEQEWVFDLGMCGVGRQAEWVALQSLAAGCGEASRHRCEFKASAGLREGLTLACFRGMGCYIFRSDRLYLAIRCGEIGLAGLGAHGHCDQNSIELMIDGVDLARDPGAYIYTALPARRNEYRSVKAHHAPRSGGREPADLKRGAFDLRDASAGECLYFGPQGFVGRHAGYGGWIYRSISLEHDRVVVLDFSPDDLCVTDPTPEPLAFSAAYGRLCPESRNIS